MLCLGDDNLSVYSSPLLAGLIEGAIKQVCVSFLIKLCFCASHFFSLLLVVSLWVSGGASQTHGSVYSLSGPGTGRLEKHVRLKTLTPVFYIPTFSFYHSVVCLFVCSVKPLYLNSGAYSFTAFGGVPAMQLRFNEVNMTELQSTEHLCACVSNCVCSGHSCVSVCQHSVGQCGSSAGVVTGSTVCCGSSCS